MKQINYIKGDATRPQEEKTLLIHVCNIHHGWGAGFVLALSKRWKEPEQQYRKWYEGFFLGNIAVVPVSPNISVVNMLAQEGFGGIAIKYDKLRECLAKVYEEAAKTGASVVGPRFGAGLAGGDWNVIEKIIEEELCDKGIKVTIYDFVV